MSPEKISVHPTFEPSKKLHDLAIIRLSQPIPDIRTVGIACLPTDPMETFANENLLTPGWGVDESGKIKLLTKFPF